MSSAIEVGVEPQILSVRARIALGVLFAIAGALATIPASYVARDAANYYNITHDSVFCCSYVSNKWYEYPFTNLVVSDWTEPQWHPNAAGSEMWLVSDGKVDGVVKFWKLLERRPIEQKE